MVVTAKIVRKKHKTLPTSIKGPRKVKVGFPAGKADSDNINKAVWNEFGTSDHVNVTTASKSFIGPTRIGPSTGLTVAKIGGIPERPFMRNSVRKNQAAYKSALAVSAPKILRGETALIVVMQKLGIKAQGDIQAEITSLMSPPNAPSTIRQKGSSKPLIDSGEMRDAVTFKVGQ